MVPNILSFVQALLGTITRESIVPNYDFIISVNQLLQLPYIIFRYDRMFKCSKRLKAFINVDRDSALCTIALKRDMHFPYFLIHCLQ